MTKIIHFNTFYGEDAEDTKLNVLDALEAEYGISSDAKQVFENPDDEADGFDLYLKYVDLKSINTDFLKSLATENELYVLVYDLALKTKIGYWFDEDDEWVKDKIDEETSVSISKIFE